MIREAIILYPAFTDETMNLEVYLPKDDWYFFPSGQNFRNQTQEGGIFSLSGVFTNINIFMRGGYIIPYQDTSNKYIQNTHYLHKEKTELLIIPDSEAHLASGEVIFDNDNYNTLAKSNYYYIKMNFIYNTVFFENFQTMSDDYTNKDLYISKLKFFRMKYLYDEGNYDLVRVKYRNGRIANIAVNILTEDKVEIDLSNLNIKFTEIDRIQFFKNN
jgi:alpha-glucosidase (family GH31 glycosyl hydrolase)